MRRLYIIIFCIAIFAGLALAPAMGETFDLKDGSSIAGDLIKSSCNQDGLLVKTPNGSYSKRVPWDKLTQESLKKLAENPDAGKFVEAYIEWTPEQRAKDKPKAAAITLKPVPHLVQPQAPSKIFALFSSPIGIMLVLAFYGLNIYAGYEVAIFKNRPAALVCGTAAVLPLFGLIIFAALPESPVKSQEELQAEAAAQAAASSEVGQEAVETSTSEETATEAQPAVPSGPVIPATVSFLRGQFTFNRRFFETKLSGFFKAVLGEAEKDCLLVIISHRGDYTGQRLSRLGQNEVYLQIFKGTASEEVMIPFNEIREVHIKHKDA